MLHRMALDEIIPRCLAFLTVRDLAPPAALHHLWVWVLRADVAQETVLMSAWQFMVLLFSVFFLDTSLIRNVCAIVSINNSLDTNLIHKAIFPPKNS